MMNKIHFLGALFFLFLATSLYADKYDKTDPYQDHRSDLDKEEFDYDSSGDKPWVEEIITKLVPPEEKNLVELDIDQPPIGFKVFIDTTSINVSERDQVVRYWLVLKAGKSRNTMFEGMKCNSNQYKTYAYENKWKKGKVNIVKAPQWQEISVKGHNQFHYELKKYYFCSDVLPRPVEDILDIIAGYKSTTSEYDPTYHHAQ